ncbi:hypothetical protein A2U01_0092007, partial [Trifolium medium]|nr:hypothetical protein [Trifolium medium]
MVLIMQPLQAPRSRDDRAICAWGTGMSTFSRKQLSIRTSPLTGACSRTRD